jgi:putative hydrolase of the HAD superfamily/pyrimidine and pyridine-specific 5'-nucleotidase
MLTHKIESFCGERLQMKEGYAYELYKKWGTCLRGMQQEGILTCPEMLEEYLEYSHDIPLHEHIGPDPELRAMLQSLDPSIPRWVFTASIEPHARRCLELLGVSDLFEGVIDVRAVDWVTKHDADAYHAAMKIANVTDPNRCLFLDDSTSNMRAAKKVGWRTVLVGEYGRDCGSKIECADADVTVGRVHELRDIAPGLFVEDAAPAGAAAV